MQGAGSITPTLSTGRVYSLVRRFIKTGIGFLVAGLLVGLFMLYRREIDDVWPTRYVATTHTHLLLVGFVLFMILGVALWIFPRPAKEDTRYRPVFVEISYWLLLTGTLGRAAGELSHGWTAGAALPWIVVSSGAAQVLGVLLFMWTMWTRIRAAGSRAREQQGERF